MKNRNSNKDVNKEFQHRPTIGENKTTAKNLPNVMLYENNTTIKQKIQKSEKLLEPSKHMRLMFPWNLYVKLVEQPKHQEKTISDITIKALHQYLLKVTQNNETKKLKEKIKELKKRSGGECEFNILEKTIERIAQKNSKKEFFS